MFRSRSARFLSSLRNHLNQTSSSLVLPDLPYDFDALEPFISAEIMRLHYTKHHQSYVDNLNRTLNMIDEANHRKDFATIIKLEPLLRFNGGGHLNHTIFWNTLISSRKSVAPEGLQGSGWAWLGFCPQTKQLRLRCCPNQDPLELTTGLIPLFGIDVWEHAYYLQYRNARSDYIDAIWNVINWNGIGKNFENIQTKKS
ncbi:superoxide dismutase [Mn] 1, mitochondrial-like protein 2 [Sarcoptes scabiei]|uniref:Superoxide dismutase n=1 Tax=Sarcoptes scabiei TaxID=52283 RepID=A0A132AN43_SARSC|nr:superoxide dismutase [Mn] 1, mitochondrial-like protein 2 [Sarcoptes scabiei]